MNPQTEKGMKSAKKFDFENIVARKAEYCKNTQGN